MIVVFWLEPVRDFAVIAVPRYEAFGSKELSLALARCEELRKDPSNTHICIQAQHDESVGLSGVSEPIHYNWYKRRPDPALPMGRT